MLQKHGGCFDLTTTGLTYHNPDRKIGLDVSDLLENGHHESLSLDAASYLQQRCKLGRTAYQDARTILKKYNSAVIPSWKELRAHQIEVTPKLFFIDNPIGVKCPYIDALEMTVKRILESIPESRLPDASSDLIFTFKDGVDGSGGHPIYNQLNNADTHSIIMSCFHA